MPAEALRAALAEMRRKQRQVRGESLVPTDEAAVDEQKQLALAARVFGVEVKVGEG